MPLLRTLGGSGALKVGADFIHEWLPNAKCYVSDPTWANHVGIFLRVQVLRWQSILIMIQKTIGVKFDELCEFFKTLNENDVVLLHPCCHNPPGGGFGP